MQKSFITQCIMEVRERVVLSNLRKLARRNLDKHPQMVVFAHDLVSHEIIARGLYEAELLQSIFGSPSFNSALYNGACLDIGANIGNHTVFFAQDFQQVMAFEPNPLTVQLLKINTRECRNVRILNIGLSARSDRGLLQPGAFNVGGSKVVAKNSEGSVAIQLEKLDAIATTPETPITFIKFDVEGHERSALLGGEVTLRRELPVILFEQHEKDFVKGTSPTIDLLKSWGYEFLTQSQANAPRWWRPTKSIWVHTTSFAPRYYPGIVAMHPKGHKLFNQ